MDILLIDFRGTAELVEQRAHLARGCLFVPEPVPPPAELTDLLLRVRAPHGAVADLRARVLQIYPGAGVALELADKPAARRVFDEWLAAAARVGTSREPTRVGWSRAEPAPADAPSPVACPSPEPVAAAVGVAAPEGAAAEAAAPEAAAAEPPAGQDEKTSGPLLDQIRAMSSQQRMHLAAHGDRAARLILVKDPNKTLQSFLLQNPHITIEEVRYLAGSRQAAPDALQTIGAHREWSQNAGVVAALVRNPKTPMSTAIRLLDRLPETELRRLAKSGDVPRGVVLAARKKINV